MLALHSSLSCIPMERKIYQISRARENWLSVPRKFSSMDCKEKNSFYCCVYVCLSLPCFTSRRYLSYEWISKWIRIYIIMWDTSFLSFAWRLAFCVASFFEDGYKNEIIHYLFSLLLWSPLLLFFMINFYFVFHFIIPCAALFFRHRTDKNLLFNKNKLILKLMYKTGRHNSELVLNFI